jgi:4-cresol dehydrogenase (hydroxylating) flavoprotein subunit
MDALLDLPLAALHEWQTALGSAHVISDPAALQDAGTATFSTRAQVRAILRPASREQVQDCVRIANRHRVPLYPISSGKNWGYGSRAPIRDGVLLDLGRLDRIVDFDEDLAYVTIEPGVTQRQLFTFLRERGSGLWMDATGASPDCSIIGNTMERGFGHTPMGDHCGNVCGFEVVLPTGERGRWGLGPSLDGLFSQSSLGIVTRLSVWLMPAPESFQAFFFTCSDENGLGPIVDALRPLRLNGTLRSVMHIGNDYKVLSGTAQYPWDETGGRVPLDRETMKRLRGKLRIAPWNGSGGLYGTRAQVREAKSRLRQALRGKVDRLQFVDDRLLRIMRRFAGPFSLTTGWDLKRTLKLLAPVYGLLKGQPTDDTLSSAYWRKKTRVPDRMDPDLDGCGLLWCSPVLPNTGDHARAVTDIATRTLLNHGFEPQMSISLATERSAICVITISYDRSVEGEDDRAAACYRELMDDLLSAGYPPYRLNVTSMGYARGDRAYSELLRKLKDAVDPNRVLAPGRYEPAGGETTIP